MEQAFFTASLTIFGGVIVFGLSQLLLRFWIEPANDHASAVRAVAHALYYWAEVYASPGVHDDAIALEAKRALRKAAGDLAATANAVNCYRLCRVFRMVPRQDCINRAVHRLTGISNGVRDKTAGRENSQMADEV